MNKEIMKPQWYIATTIIGSEESIYSSLLDKIKAYKFNDLVKEMKIVKYNDITIETFKDVVNPPPKTMRNSKNISWETKPDGTYIKKTTKVYNKFPGYLFICMNMTEEVWYTIRNTPGITGFIGSSGKGAKPIPISEFELEELFDPEKNKDIIRYVNASSVSIEEVDHVEEENPIKPIYEVEFFNSKATTASVLSSTRKIDFEKRQLKNKDEKITDNDDESKLDIDSIDENKIIENNIEEKAELNEFPNQSSNIKENLNDNTKFIKKNDENKKVLSLDFKVGNTIKILDGSFKDSEAIIIKIDDNNEIITCEVDLFGRSVEVKLKKDQIIK